MNGILPDVLRGAIVCLIATFAGLGAFQLLLRFWKSMRRQRPKAWVLLAAVVGLILQWLNYMLVGWLILSAFSAALYVLSFVVQCPDHSILTSRPGQVGIWFRRAAWAALSGCVLGLSAWTIAELGGVGSGESKLGIW
jgi:hypothetical protein